MRLFRCIVAAFFILAAWAGNTWALPYFPEIDWSGASSAIGLLVCAVLVLFERRVKI